MQLKPLAFLTVALSACQVTAGLAANDVVANIKSITNITSSSRDIAGDFSPGDVLRDSLIVVDKLHRIGALVIQDILKIAAHPATLLDKDDVSKNVQLEVCDSLSDFVKLHQDLLKAVTGHKSLLHGTPLTAPIGTLLRVLEGGVDNFALGIIRLVPTCAGKARFELKRLDRTFDDAIQSLS